MQYSKPCTILIATFVLFLLGCSKTEYRRISVDEFVNKMKAGWVGQMAGVGWGAPTEFKHNGHIIPMEAVPEWKPEMINQHYQDDIYVEMTFLRTLEQYGLDVPIRQAGIDFANSGYMLWHANKAGRDNLRAGIAPPWSGHPKYNSHADDIDYQIEADYSGLISPGLPQAVIDLGEKFGRLMNYGDGLYGGQFVAGMYAEAFFNSNIEEIIQAGLACIPEASEYHQAISDVVEWHHEEPDNWQKTWHKIKAKYQDNPDGRKFSCSDPTQDFNIDAKINGAYIAMGMLYGKGDLDSTIVISMRCGQDSDCNPSNAAGVIFTALGYDKLPAKYISAIDLSPKFSFTEYNFASLTEVSIQLAKDIVQHYGGRVETNAQGEEEFVIPIRAPKPSELERSWEPRPAPVDVMFTEEEMKKITIRNRKPEEYIREWKVSGPYEMKGKTGLDLFDIQFPPEVKRVEKVKWKSYPMGKEGYSTHIVELHKLFGGEERVAYLYTKMKSESTRHVFFELGSDDGVKIWVNDKLVHQKNVNRGLLPGEDRFAVALADGWNTVKIKLTQGTGDWGLALNVVSENGSVPDDLVVGTE